MSIRLLVLAGLLLLAGCQPGDPFGCFESFDNGDYAEAAVACKTAYGETGDLRYGEKAIEANYQSGNLEGLKDWLTVYSGTRQEATIWSRTGQMLIARGMYAEADEAYSRSIQLQTTQGDLQGIASSLYARSYAAYYQSRYQDALELAAESFEKAVEVGDSDRELRALYLLFSVFEDLGYYDSAEEVLTMVKERIPPDSPTQRVYYLVNESALRLRQDRMSLARNSLEESLQLAAGSQDHNTIRTIHINLAEANLSLGNIDVAEQHVNAALAQIDDGHPVPTALLFNQALIYKARQQYPQAIASLQRALNNQDIPSFWKWQLFYEIGESAQAMNNVPLLINSNLQAISELEKWRGTLGMAELRAALLNQQRRPYESLFAHYAKTNQVADALNIFERAKARAFLDAYIQALDTVPKPDSVETGLAQVAARQDVLTGLLPAMNASLLSSPRQAEGLLPALGERRILAYFKTGDELWLLTTADGLRIRRLHNDINAVWQLADRFLNNIDDAQVASELGSILLPEDLLAGYSERLYIIPDTRLGQVPFAALKVAGRYLVQDHIISYVPSINSLLEIESDPVSGATDNAVVIGDPAHDLANAREEAKEIASILNVSPFLGEQATDQAFYQSRNARLLHLATHSGFKANGPWFNLSNAEITPTEILQGKVAPRIVALASCTSAGKDGQDVWGSLSTAFLAAGSDAVLASLWTIDDLTARQFMTKFYQGDALNDPARTLAEAQRYFIDHNLSVQVWSAFVLLGANITFNTGEA